MAETAWPVVALAVLAIALGGCASTSVTTKYRDPDVRRLEFEKVAAMAIHNDGPQRRLAEAEMVNRIGPDAVAASKIIPDDARGDMKKVREFYTGEDIDSLVNPV